MSESRIHSPSRIHRGLVYIAFSSLMFSLMGACVFASRLWSPELDWLIPSFVRVTVNLLALMIPSLIRGRLSGLFGDGRRSLWYRGWFGASALMCSFASIQEIGPGESSFIQSSSTIFVALLSPLLLNYRITTAIWLAIFGSIAGLGLLMAPSFDQGANWARGAALLAGLLSAMAYVMVARAGRTNSPRVVVFYFCIVAFGMHAAYLLCVPEIWPDDPKTWGAMLACGVFASLAQEFMTRGYQLAPAPLASVVSYLNPVFSLIWGTLWFSLTPSPQAFAGCVLILLFGVALPFLRKR